MKKRTLAILLAALLIVSAVCILAACNNEYTVTFREANGKSLEKVTTVKGVATVSEKTLTKAGYTFDGWYKTVSMDESENYVFTDKVDLTKTVFTEDTDLYGKWIRSISKGEDEGYCVIGVIGGVQDWDPESRANDPASQLTYVGDPINLYSITLDLKANDSVKIKTSYKDWDTKEINYGADKVTKITKGADATLPSGIEKVEALFSLPAGDNININCDMNATFNFYYNGKNNSYIEIVVNSVSGTILAPVEDTGFIVIGDMTDWTESITSDNTAKSKYILTTEDKNIWTATGIEIGRGQGFKIKVNENGWNRGEYGFGTIEEVTIADSVTALPEGITSGNAEDLFSGNAGDAKGNIGASYPMTINVTFNNTTKKLSIEVTALDPTEQKTDAELGYFVVCTPNNFYNADTVEATDATNGKYVMVVDKERETLFAAEGIELKAGHTFRVKLNVGGWNCAQYNYTHAKFVLGTDVTLPEGITDVSELFEDTGAGYPNDNNILIKGANVTVSISLDTSLEEEQLVITVTAVELEERTDDDYGYIVTGPFTGTSWLSSIEATDENYSKYIFTQDAENKHLFEVTLDILKDQQFVVKVNVDNWNTQYGMSAAKFVNGTGADLPAGMTMENIFTGSGNITVNAKATLKLTLNTAPADGEKALTVTIVEIEATEIITDADRGIIVVGTINGWNGTDDTYKLTANADKTVFTITDLELDANAEIKLKVCKEAWDPEWGYHGENLTVVLDESLTGTAGEYINKAEKSANILIKKACTVTIVFNYDAATPANSTYTITVTGLASGETTEPTTPEVTPEA